MADPFPAIRSTRKRYAVHLPWILWRAVVDKMEIGLSECSPAAICKCSVEKVLKHNICLGTIVIEMVMVSLIR
jgi:hypothetical protein